MSDQQPIVQPATLDELELVRQITPLAGSSKPVLNLCRLLAHHLAGEWHGHRQRTGWVGWVALSVRQQCDGTYISKDTARRAIHAGVATGLLDRVTSTSRDGVTQWQLKPTAVLRKALQRALKADGGVVALDQASAWRGFGVLATYVLAFAAAGLNARETAAALCTDVGYVRKAMRKCVAAGQVRVLDGEIIEFYPIDRNSYAENNSLLGTYEKRLTRHDAESNLHFTSCTLVQSVVDAQTPAEQAKQETQMDADPGAKLSHPRSLYARDSAGRKEGTSTSTSDSAGAPSLQPHCPDCHEWLQPEQYTDDRWQQHAHEMGEFVRSQQAVQAQRERPIAEVIAELRGAQRTQRTAA